jgi:hypothetical protein
MHSSCLPLLGQPEKAVFNRIDLACCVAGECLLCKLRGVEVKDGNNVLENDSKPALTWTP